MGELVISNVVLNIYLLRKSVKRGFKYIASRVKIEVLLKATAAVCCQGEV